MRLLTVFLSLIFYLQTPSSAYVGEWKLLGGSVVEIYKKDNRYEGKIVKRSRFPIYNRNGLDNKNPNMSLRKNRIIGLVVLKNLSYHNGILQGGTLYNVDSGESYKVKLQIDQKSLTYCLVTVMHKGSSRNFRIKKL